MALVSLKMNIAISRIGREIFLPSLGGKRKSFKFYNVVVNHNSRKMRMKYLDLHFFKSGYPQIENERGCYKRNIFEFSFILGEDEIKIDFNGNGIADLNEFLMSKSCWIDENFASSVVLADTISKSRNWGGKLYFTSEKGYPEICFSEKSVSPITVKKISSKGEVLGIEIDTAIRDVIRAKTVYESLSELTKEPNKENSERFVAIFTEHLSLRYKKIQLSSESIEKCSQMEKQMCRKYSGKRKDGLLSFVLILIHNET